MTPTQEAAMRQALEALERYGGVDQRACDAEEALRAALAEPVQEPIGYLWPTGRHPEFRFTQQKRDGIDGTPVYTAPPQRKPLSNTELARIWDDALDQLDPRDQLRFVARAIEKAHGIGEQP